MIPPKHHGCLVDMARMELMKVTGAEANEVSYWEGEAQKGLSLMLQDQYAKGKVKRTFGSYGYITQTGMPWKLTNYTEGVDAS